MEQAGVLHRETVGRSTMLRLNLERLNAAVTQLSVLCCSEVRQETVDHHEATE